MQIRSWIPAPLIIRILLLVVLIALLLSHSAAQSLFGTILGTLTDSTGAVVPRATIKTKNTGTGAVRTTTSNEAGDYQIPTMPVGVYEVSVEASGFKRSVVASVTLAVDQRARVDFQLDVGSME